MAETAQKQFISLPLKFVFTDEGSSALLRQNVRINRLKMGDQTEDYGVFLDKITPDFLQRMIMMNYISKIEVSGVDPAESRTDIIGLSKLIVLSILNKSYADICLEQLLASSPVKQWNHLNPSMVIDDKTQFKDGLLESFMERHSDELTEIQQELMDPIINNINNDTALQQDEKENRCNLLHDFLSSIYPLAWFAIIKFRNTREYSFLLRTVRLCLVESLKKTNVAEFASLMLMELASNIVNINIQKEAKKLYGNENLDVKQILLDPKWRLPVIESLRQKKNLLTFSWKLGGGTTSFVVGSKGRFQVVLYDQDINYIATRDSMAQSKSADVKRFNLSEFYKKLHDSGNDLELGMFYLSFLDEACTNMGVKFESAVNQSQLSGMGQTITTLSFIL